MRGSLGVNSTLITGAVDLAFSVPCTFYVDEDAHAASGLFDSKAERTDARGAIGYATVLGVASGNVPSGVKRNTRVLVDAPEGGLFQVETYESNGRGRVEFVLARVKA